MAIRVLIFDDDPQLRVTLERWIEHQRDLETVGQAADGVEAVSIASRVPADVIVMDLKMPRLSGMAAMKRLRRRGVTTPFVVLTGDDSARAAVASVPGATFLSKARAGAAETVSAIRRAASAERKRP